MIARLDCFRIARRTGAAYLGVIARTDPRSAFAGQSADPKWDKLHAGYFSSYARWGYLTTPLLYTYPGFDAREIDPWYEKGERWRVLQVTFPGHEVSRRIAVRAGSCKERGCLFPQIRASYGL